MTEVILGVVGYRRWKIRPSKDDPSLMPVMAIKQRGPNALQLYNKLVGINTLLDHYTAMKRMNCCSCFGPHEGLTSTKMSEGQEKGQRVTPFSEAPNRPRQSPLTEALPLGTERLKGGAFPGLLGASMV